MTDDLKLTFMGMEITPAEAVSLIGEGWFVASCVVGVSSYNANLSIAKQRGLKLMERISAMHMEPTRRHVKCATCGQSRMETSLSPDGTPGYVVVADESATPTERAASEENA